MKRYASLLGLLACSLAAHASDGVIEINHAKIMAGSGYPYYITQAGSYRLTSNLAQPTPDTVVILIGTDNATIDLNGFAITGSNTCTQAGGVGTAVTCTTNSAYAGIDIAGPGWRSGLTVRNGKMQGLGGICIFLGYGQNNAVEDVTASHCGQGGIAVPDGLVTRSRVSYTGSLGIRGGVVSHSISSNNNSDGIFGDGLVVQNISHGNAGHGINLSNGSAIGNTVHRNGQYGISGSGAGNKALTQNNAFDNTTGQIFFTIGTSVPANSNLCNGAPC